MAVSVLLLGATGTIGRATLAALLTEGHRVTALVRGKATLPKSVATVVGDVTDAHDLRRAMAEAEVVISCLASRSGAPTDAWAIDHAAHGAALDAAVAAGARRWIQLSAICVQKPRLAFQHAKLAFETQLIASGLDYTIVRPTAYFKSLSGQVRRVQAGKPYLMFGDGTLTACKPISDGDLARYLVACIATADRKGAILPIGGPGPALTPRAMGETLFRLTGRAPRFRSVPPGFLRMVAGGLGLLGSVSPAAARRAEFARTGHYYATESMLVWDAATKRYDAAATPETGTETLFDFYEKLIAGREAVDLGEHALFDKTRS